MTRGNTSTLLRCAAVLYLFGSKRDTRRRQPRLHGELPLVGGAARAQDQLLGEGLRCGEEGRRAARSEGGVVGDRRESVRTTALPVCLPPAAVWSVKFLYIPRLAHKNSSLRFHCTNPNMLAQYYNVFCVEMHFVCELVHDAIIQCKGLVFLCVLVQFSLHKHQHFHYLFISFVRVVCVLAVLRTFSILLISCVRRGYPFVSI